MRVALIRSSQYTVLFRQLKLSNCEKMNSLVLVGLAIFAIAASQSQHNHNHHHNHHSHHVEQQESENTLVLVNVLFRHGNRTADSIAELYPKDPYLNFDYFPYGLGQLTTAGKLREYSVGINLRTRYNNFLGEYYYPEIVEARSTDYNRTKMSLQLVLAGLFPPRRDDIFADEMFAWQPVPYNYVPRSEDKILLGNLCPKYIQMYESYTKSPKMRSEYKKYNKVFNYLTQNTGLNVTRYLDVYQMYFGLSTEAEYGLDLPLWTAAVWPAKIIDLSIREYFVSMATTEMRKLLAGYLLEKIIDDARAKLTSNASGGRKMYLYSAHENNIAQLLLALDVFENHIPNYGAYVIVEIHRINGVAGVKILYDNWTGEGLKTLKMPGCETFCPFDRFVGLVEEYLPRKDNDLCGN